VASAIVDRWHARLENWAWWIVSGASASISSAYRGPRICDDDAPPRAPPPLIGEAHDVDRLVHKLSPEQQRALRAWFIWTGGVADRERTLGVHPDTLRDRVRKACYSLDDLWHQRRPRAVPQRQQTTA
jgi:hypothetical protein